MTYSALKKTNFLTNGKTVTVRNQIKKLLGQLSSKVMKNILAGHFQTLLTKGTVRKCYLCRGKPIRVERGQQPQIRAVHQPTTTSMLSMPAF